MFIGVLQSPKLFDPKELVPVLLASRHPLLDHTAGLSVTAAVEIIDDFSEGLIVFIVAVLLNKQSRTGIYAADPGFI